MTGQEKIELRRRTTSGWTYSIVSAADVPAEVALLSNLDTTIAVELKAVGADKWRRAA